MRKIRKRQPKLIEGAKTTLLVRGNKTSNAVLNFMKNIVHIVVSLEGFKKRKSYFLFKKTRDASF